MTRRIPTCGSSGWILVDLRADDVQYAARNAVLACIQGARRGSVGPRNPAPSFENYRLHGAGGLSRLLSPSIEVGMFQERTGLQENLGVHVEGGVAWSRVVERGAPASTLFAMRGEMETRQHHATNISRICNLL